MSLAAPRQPVRPSIHADPPRHLDLLADAVGYSNQPVWIHNPDGVCVYSNELAEERDPGVHRLAFELFDHAGTLVGRLITVAA